MSENDESKFILKMPEVALIQAHLCVSCYPVVKPGFFILNGNSLCKDCFIPRRKALDIGPYEVAMFAGVTKRDYKSTWGEEPVKETEGD